MKTLYKALVILSFFSCSLMASTQTTQYAQETAYASTGNGTYVHLGIYPNFRILTDVSEEHFGEQVIEDYEGEILYANDERSEYVSYKDFFILVNYYDTFKVVTGSPWMFDGIYQLSLVNVQYIEFYD